MKSSIACRFRCGYCCRGAFYRGLCELERAVMTVPSTMDAEQENDGFNIPEVEDFIDDD